MDQSRFDIRMLNKEVFQCIMFVVIVFHELNKIKRIRGIERTMSEVHKALQVCFRMIQDEFIRSVVHYFKQLPALVNNGFKEFSKP